MPDNRYGVFRYGTSNKYGASSLTTESVLAWAIEVDWDGDGLFDGTNEAFYLIKAPSIKRGRKTMIKPSGQGFESVRTGQATITLSNHDGRYDAWNASSPLYPNVESGKDIRIRVMDRSTGTIYKRFYGIIQDIAPSGYGENARVTLHCDDAMRVLRDTEILAKRTYPDGTLAPVSISACINELLDKIQWPTRWGRNIDSSSYGVRYWYSSGERNVATELEDLALSFFGYIFITNDGKIRFIDKFSNPSSGITITQSKMLKDIGNPQPWTIRRQVVKIRFHVRKRADDTTVWQPLDSDSPIESSGTKSLVISYNHDGYPVYLEDFQSNIVYSRSPYILDDSGLTVTATLTDYGSKVFATFENPNSDVVYLYPTTTYIKGDITWTERTDSISSPRDPSTIVNPRSLVLDSLWYQDRNQAYDFVDNYQDFISLLHQTPIVQLENRFDEQFTPELFDLILMSIVKLGVSFNGYRIGAIEDEAVGETTQAVRTIFYIEPRVDDLISNMGFWSDALNEWDWDDVNWGW